MRIPLRTPARQPKFSQRSLTGRTASAGQSVIFESTLERDCFILLDFDPSVLRFASQPFSIRHEVDGADRRYTPDVMVEFAGPDGRLNRTVVYEIKYRDDLRDHWSEYRARFAAANRYCRQQGWVFEIMTEREIRTPLLENATFLRRYRTIPDRPLVRMHLLYTLQALGPTTPQALLAATYNSNESRAPALSTLWQLIATRQIPCDLSQKLTMRSRIEPGDA